LAPEVTTSDS
jgi:hypothetical protein